MTSIPLEFSKVERLGDRIIGRINAAREFGPIWWSDEERCWVVTGHAQVLAGFRETVKLSNNRAALMAALVPEEDERQRLMPNTMRFFPQFLTNLEGERHLRMRRLMMKAFSRGVVESYRPFARQVIAETLDAIGDRDMVEFVEEIGREVTGRNLLRIIGLEDEAFYQPKLKYWAYVANAGLGGHGSKEAIAEMDAAFGEMVSAFQIEIDRRRATPREDFLSLLIQAEEGGQRLTDEELLGNMHLILIAGHDTTLNTMALSVRTLATHAAQRQQMRDNPDEILNAVMELMRYVAMSTQMARLVAHDCEWEGQSLKKGQIVRLIIAGANRDPRVFAEPERLDLTRPQDENMAFAPGAHHCIGHLFAKMQLTEFFPEFLRRYVSFEVLDEQIHFGGGLSFRGPQELHLKLKAHPTRKGAVVETAS